MAEQLELPLVSRRQFAPSTRAVEGAAQYSGGKHNPEGLAETQADSSRAFRIQQAYRGAQESPGEAPGIKESYDAFRRDVNKQYDFMTAPKDQGGMGIKHTVQSHEPYWDSDFKDQAGTARRMIADVESGHISTNSSANAPHAYLTEQENDKARAVHDVFGHAAIGRSFSRHGEEAAYLSHRQMFSKAALPAVTSEFRGQNAMLNYSPQRDFPDQSKKLVGLPKFAQETGKLKSPSRKSPGPSGQESLF